jgi:dTDP-4-amino-4,6-dideoxygalactose transaminase
MISFIKPSKPNMEMFNKLLESSIETNHYTNFGTNHNLLKQKISELVGTDKVILVANATLALDGLHDILSTKCGAAYLPSFTFPATNQGCRVSSVMSNTYSGGHHIGRAYWNNTAQGDTYAVTVNPFGCLNKPCEKPKTKYWIIDNAAGLLTQTKDWMYNGADAVIYSLHATKILSACEGGVVVFKDNALYEEYLEYINFGFRQQANGSRTVSERGSNHKMSELSAAWCLMNLETLNEEILKRIDITNVYLNFCEKYDIPFIHSLQTFWLLGKEPALKIQKFAFERGVDVRPYYQRLSITNEKCMITDTFNMNGVCLPSRPTLTNTDEQTILEMLEEAKRLNLV